MYYNACYVLITSSESYHVLSGKPFLLDPQLQVFWRLGRAIRHQRPASQGDSATKGGWFKPLFTAALQCPLNYLCTPLLQAGLWLTAFSWVPCDKGAHRESKSLCKIALVSSENFIHSYIVPGLGIMCLIIPLSQKRTIEPMEVSWLTWGQADLRSSYKFPFFQTAYWGSLKTSEAGSRVHSLTPPTLYLWHSPCVQLGVFISKLERSNSRFFTNHRAARMKWVDTFRVGRVAVHICYTSRSQGAALSPQWGIKTF